MRPNTADTETVTTRPQPERERPTNNYRTRFLDPLRPKTWQLPTFLRSLQKAQWRIYGSGRVKPTRHVMQRWKIEASICSEKRLSLLHEPSVHETSPYAEQLPGG